MCTLYSVVKRMSNTKVLYCDSSVISVPNTHESAEFIEMYQTCIDISFA